MTDEQIPTSEVVEEKVDIHKKLPEVVMGVDRVGVSGLDFPLTVQTADGQLVNVDAVFDMFGSLLKDIKGIDMSRFPETLMLWIEKPLSSINFKDLLLELRKRIKADDVYTSASFKYFIRKCAPVSKLEQIV